VQLRFEAAVAGVVPVIRVLQESLAGHPIERIHGIVNGTTNFILTEMARTAAAPTPRRSPRRSGSATPRPTRATTSAARRGREDGDPRAAGVRHAGALDEVRYEGIEQISRDDIEYARELGLGLKLIGTAERLDGGLSVRVHPAFLYPGIRWRRWRPFNAVTVESRRSPRSRCPARAPAARRPRARCSAT
jgi:homoserine dehydrogenase